MRRRQTRKEGKALYDAIHKLCLQYPEYRGNDFIYEFIAKYVRKERESTVKNITTDTLASLCFFISQVERKYRRVREQEFKSYQNQEKSTIRQQEEQIDLGYSPNYQGDIKKGKTL